MNAYLTYDRIEAQNWTRHYQQIAREEKESELADDRERTVASHAGVAVYGRATASRRQQKKKRSAGHLMTMSNSVSASEFVRYMVEVFSRHQIDIESEE